MKKKNSRRLIVALVLIVFGYIGIELFQYFYNSYETEITLSFAVNDSVSVDGVFIREESVINTQLNNNVHYLLTDGSRVSKSYEVAEVYSNPEDAQKQLQINALQAQKEVLLSSQNEGALASYDVDLVSKQIDKYFGNVYDMASIGDFSELTNEKNNLLIYLNRRRISLGIEENYNEKVSAIDAEIQSLKSSVSRYPKKVLSPTSGFFVSGTDGCENILTNEKFKTLSFQDMKDLIDKGAGTEDGSNYVGKIITDYTWSYAFCCNNEVASRLKVGSSAYINFSFNGSETLRMTVERIEYSEDKKEAVVVLSCDEMSEYVSSARYYSANIVFNSFNGLRVNKSAIRMKNETKGVYIRIGNQIKFKKIEIIYETDDFIISTKGLNDSSYLQIYDEIVIDGKNLYDGKHIN